MCRPAPILAVSLLVLFTCSCGYKAEIEKAQAEAQAARAEAAEARAKAEVLQVELDKLNAHENRHWEVAKPDTLIPDRAREAKAQALQKERLVELVARWNAAADSIATTLQGFGPMPFHWDGTHFPHPTFKLGSAEAYGEFAKILLAFLEKDDNLTFVTDNGLASLNLQSGVAGPKGPNAGWTLAELTEQFSRPGAHGTHDEATRKSLKKLSEKIRTRGEG